MSLVAAMAIFLIFLPHGIRRKAASGKATIPRGEIQITMRNIQEVYNELQENKKEQKNIKREYKDALANANEYEETMEKLKELKEKKKQIENLTQARLGARWDEYEKLKAKSEELGQMLTDIAMTTLMDGKTVAIKDEYDNSYEPVYKISFKKVS